MLINYWYIAAGSSELNENDILNTTLFGRSIVLFKSHGKVIALEDRCAHRNAPLSAGKICNGKIECPYHGWQYNENGIPYNPTLDKQEKVKIKSYKCIEQEGYIWICIGNEPIQDRPYMFEKINDKEWTTFRMKTKFQGTIEQCLENFLDCPHAEYVHKFWFRAPTKKKVDVVIRTNNDGAEVEYFNEPREKSLVHNTLLSSKNNIQHIDRFIMPSISKVDYILSKNKHYIITSFCSPINEHETLVDTIITFKYNKIGWLIKPFFRWLSKIIIKQDVKIMKLQRDNIKKFGKESFYISKSDLLLPYIINYRKAADSNTKSPLSNIEKKLEIVL